MASNTIIPGRRAEYRKRLNDPAKRASIPDNYLKALSPALFARRQSNAKTAYNNSTLYNPMALLQGDALRKAASSLAGLEIDPQIAADKEDLALTRANYAELGRRQSGYNKLLMDSLGQGAAAAKTNQTELAGQLQATHDSAVQGVDDTYAKSQDFLKEDQALRGQGISNINEGIGNRLATEFQQQRQSVDTQMNANTAAGNVAGQGWAGLAQLMQGVGALRAADASSQAANAGVNAQQKIQTDIKGLEASKGAATAKYTQDLRQSQFENAITAKTLGIKEEDAQTAADKVKSDADAKAKDRQIRRDQLDEEKRWHDSQDALRRDLAKLARGDKSAALREQIKHDRAMEKNARARVNKMGSGAGGKNGKSPYTFLPDVAHAEQIGLFDKVKSFIEHNKAQGRHKNANVLLNANSIKELKAQYGKASPAIITAALDAVYNHHLSDASVKKLHDAGIRVNKLPVRTRRQLGLAGRAITDVASKLPGG